MTTTLVVVPPLVATLALGLAVNGHRVISLVLMVVMLGVGTLLRRYGARGFLAGIPLFVGFFLGYFLRGAVSESGLGWLVAEIGVGVGASLLVRFALFYPRPARDLARMQRSYVARARKVAHLALDVFDHHDGSDEAGERRLHRHLVRLNEAALMIDGQLATPNAMDEGSSAYRLHQRIFDIELAMTNIARFALSMSRMDQPVDQRDLVRRALIAIDAGDLPVARAAGCDLAVLVAASAFVTSDMDGADRVAAVIRTGSPARWSGWLMPWPIGLPPDAATCQTVTNRCSPRRSAWPPAGCWARPVSAPKRPWRPAGCTPGVMFAWPPTSAPPSR